MSNILSWNAIALEISRRDHSQGYANGQHSGPTRTSRALAIAHIAIYNAVAAVQSPGKLYQDLGASAPLGGSPDVSAVVDGAASQVLRLLYPRHMQLIDDSVSTDKKTDAYKGGFKIGQAVFESRMADKSDLPDPSPPGDEQPYGAHRPDPYDSKQPLLGKHWGKVDRFTNPPHQPLGLFPGSGSVSYLDNAHYLADYQEVKAKGAKGGSTRTPEETMIGTYWGYDGATGLGVPPRLYNQIVRTIIWDRMNASKGAMGDLEMALLFAKVNVAMADAGIDAWHYKYLPANNLWRPVIGIRKERAGHASGSTPDYSWAPLGAPQTNRPGTGPRTPPFPAYPSGHATFGAAVFQVLRLHFAGAPITVQDVLAARPSDAKDDEFMFTSDEMDGIATDTDGSIRTRLDRRFTSYAYAVHENAVSRVYLGVHWRFDGLPKSNAVGDDLNVGGVPLGLHVGEETHTWFTALTTSKPSSELSGEKKVSS